MKTILFVILFSGVLALILGLYIRRREIAFEGVVTDKDVRETNSTNNMNQTQGTGITLGSVNNGGVTHQYMIKVQTDSGKTLNWQVSEGKYQIINIGDRVAKRAGTTDVDVTPKVQTDQNQPLPPQPTPTN